MPHDIQKQTSSFQGLGFGMGLHICCTVYRCSAVDGSQIKGIFLQILCLRLLDAHDLRNYSLQHGFAEVQDWAQLPIRGGESPKVPST